MKGQTTFRASVISEVRALVAQKQGKDKYAQKQLRDGLRDRGFCISDFGTFRPHGFTVADLDKLIASRQITVTP